MSTPLLCLPSVMVSAKGQYNGLLMLKVTSNFLPVLPFSTVSKLVSEWLMTIELWRFHFLQ